MNASRTAAPVATACILAMSMQPALAEPWAERRFILCYRDAQSLTPAAQLLVEHLAALAPP